MRTVLVAILLLTPAAAAQLPADLVARAKAIHARIFTIDPAESLRWRRRTDPTVRGENQVDFPKMREGGYDGAFFIVYVGQGRLDGAGFHLAKKQAMLKFDAIQRMAERFPKDIGLARSADAVGEIRKSGRLVACIGIENGYPMGEDLSLIEEFHRRGARYMGIAHNRHSQLGDSHTPKEPLHGGLSALGRKAVLEMNRVGIMVDISHASKTTMLQAVELSKAPCIASHSGCHAVYAHSRNLDDEQIRALAKKGGVIQCVALGAFVKDVTAREEARAALRKELDLPGWWEIYQMKQSDDGLSDDMKKRLQTFEERCAAGIDTKHPDACVRDFVDHIDHAVRVAGIDHVGIASDFDGGGGVEGWRDASQTFQVTLELVRRGYEEEQIAKIWSGNTLRLWRDVEKVATRLRKSKKDE